MLVEGTDMLSERSVNSYQPTLCNIPEERRLQGLLFFDDIHTHLTQFHPTCQVKTDLLV
jgi:hypothetical protein